MLPDSLDGNRGVGLTKTSIRELAASNQGYYSWLFERMLGKEQLNRLLLDLDEAEDPHHCPHGRPTRVCYSIDELKKVFERT